MTQSSVLLLGPFQVQHHGDVITHFRGDKVRALLAYLAVEADRPHTRSALIGLLWPEQPEDRALDNLTQALIRLRQALADGEDPLIVTRQTVQWQDDAATVDVHAFLRLAGSDAVADLEQASALYRDEFLTGFGLPACEAFEDWLLLTRERLGHQVLEVLQRLGEGYLVAGQAADAVAAARRQLALDPWREVAYRQLMRALAESGDRSGALAAYARCQTVLADELDITPDEETRLLAEQIEAGEVVPTSQMPQPVAGPERAHNLPAPLTRLVGREDELAMVSGRLAEADGRLLTVVGAGGSGKSRLALAAAWDLRPSFPDGVWWVELAGIQAGNDPTLQCTTVATAIAAALGVTLNGRRSPLEELAGELGDHSALLVLDNCEHLSEVAAIAHTVLEAAPRLRLLATSREPLGLSGETLLPLEGLPVPDEGDSDAGAAPAVQLFLDRAARHTSGWGQDPADVEGAARLCRLLEGMPLGIELAAHWVGHYTPDEIAEALQRDLAFLAARTHDVPERQRSLRAVFAYSWSLLTDAEQQALSRLSVFRRSVDRTAAQAVAGITPTTLVTLVDKSLVRRAEARRYGLHELLRQFAAERLAEAGEVSALRDRHLAHYLALAEQAAPELKGPDQQEWLERLERDLDNLRAALAWAREQGEAELGLQLASALVRFWDMRSHASEGRTWLQAALTAGAAAPARVRAAALDAAGWLAYYQGDFGQARTLQEEALALWRELGDRAGIPTSLNNLGAGAYGQGDAARAVALFEEALALRRGLGDRHGIASSLNNLGVVAVYQGDFGRAVALLEEVLALWRELGDRHNTATALTNLASLAYWQGDIGRAEALLEEALPLARELGDKALCALSVIYLGHSASWRGDATMAATHYQEATQLCRDVGDKYLLPYALEGWGWATRDEGNGERAAQLYGAAAALRAATDGVLAPHEAADREQKLSVLRESLGVTAFEHGWAAGQRMLPEEALALALEEGTAPASLDEARSPASGLTAR
jgi:predicted ATPase/DNA-binding SARP family transcriptional activator/Tfp pilus assembly protein PilF